MKTKNVSLCFLLNEHSILLAKKKRGFGVGNWNGAGGKLLPGESFETATVREAKEEIGVDISEGDLQLVAVLEFYFAAKPSEDAMHHHCPVYFASRWSGEPLETEEMQPQWFERDKLPFEKMWEDDIFWLPRVLQGEKLHASFWFDEKFHLINKQISPLKEKTV